MVDRSRKVRTKSKTPQDETVNLHQIDSQLGTLGVLLMLLCGAISSYLLSNLPSALTRADLESHPGAFIAERAWENLKVLNDIGPKPIGTQANEKLAANYIRREIEMIEASKHPNQKLLVNHQLVTGGHSVGLMGHPLTSLYRNLQNLVVQLVGDEGDDEDTGPALMLNCHFDTVASSPGASDDCASCCVMLEILRVLSREPRRNRHSLIFLFNGAEETSLQAAHGFITQHPWANQVAAFLNLESAGSGGKEILFQSGPQHPWLIDLYAKAIRHPFAHAAAEEVFQSGLIPSDTDFRMFRDFGHVPGMDFAHVADGYRYHTKFDNIDYLSVSVLQRTGDNILSLTREMVNCDELLSKEEKGIGSCVFFDYLGLFFVRYSTGAAKVINIIVSILVVFFPIYGLIRAVPNAITSIYKETAIGFLATVSGTILSTVAVLIIGHELDSLGYALSWYSSRYLILGLYCGPALLCHCFSQIAVNKLFEDKKTTLNISQIAQSRLIGVSLFWSLLIVPLTLAGIRSTYIIMVLALLALLSSLTTTVLGYHNRTRKWLCIHLLFQIPTMLWASNYYHAFMQTFIPISGRIGGARNPELFIGLIASFCTLLIGSYITPLILILKKPSELTARIMAPVLITYFLTCFTSVSFPYRDDSTNAPTVQRHYITHTLRNYYDERGDLRNSDSGFLFREMDRNSERVIRDIVNPAVPVRMREMSSCRTELFCAVPFYSMWHQIRFDNFWLPGPEPMMERMITLSVREKIQINENIWRLVFTLDTGIQTSLIIGPKPGVKLVNWNLLQELTPPTEFNGQKGHFVLINYGLSGAPWNMTLDFEQQSSQLDGSLTDIAIISTLWESHEKHTQEFQELLGLFPSWAHVVPSVAAVNVYVF